MNDGAAHAEGRRPKASKGGNRAGETYVGAARSIYEDLRAARNPQRQAIFNGRRPRVRAQLRRYGTDIAKWGFQLSRRM